MRNISPHIWVAISNWVNRGVAVLLQLAIIPMLARALGQREFAAYALVASLLSWFALLDFGLGNALQNYVSESKATRRDVGAHAALVFLLSCGIVLVGGILVVALSPLIARFLFSGIEFAELQNGTTLLTVAGFCFLCHAVGAVGTKVLYALGRGILANLLLIGTNSIAFVALWLALSWAPRENALLAAVVAYSGSAGLIAVVVAATVLWRLARWSRDDIKRVSAGIAKRASAFWLFALLGVGVYNVDYLIMSQTLAAQEIATYNVLSRIFGAAMSLYSGLLGATWPFWTELSAGKKWEEFKSGVRTYLILGTGSVFFLTLAMTFAIPALLPMLFKDNEVYVSLHSIILFGAYIGLRVWMDTYSVALRAMNDTGTLLKWALFQGILSIGGQVGLSMIFGLDGILLGLILSSLLTAAWALPVRFRWQVSRPGVS